MNLKLICLPDCILESHDVVDMDIRMRRIEEGKGASFECTMELKKMHSLIMKKEQGSELD